MSDTMPAQISSEVKHLLVLCPTWVGDCVMATPAFRAARRALPEARITALGQPGLEALLMPSPWFDAFAGVDAKGLAGTRRASQLVKRLVPAVDAALLLPNSFRSALIPWLARVPVRAGVRSDWRSGMLTEIIDVPGRNGIRATLEHYALLAEAAFGVSHGAIDRTMELQVSPEQQADADRVLAGVREPFVLLNPGAVRTNKRWPAEKFAQLADVLAQRFGVRVAVTGSPGERDVIAAVVGNATTGIVDLAARGVTLGSLKGVIRRAALLITNDTGPRHIALALGTPVVSLFGPTDPRHTLIDSANERILRAEPFLPEELVADDYEKACTMERISVGDVAAACAALLGAPQAQPAEAR
jgi:heptosyltransferase-2